MHKLGTSVRNISERLDIPKSTVQDIITLFKNEGNVDARKSTGRP